MAQRDRVPLRSPRPVVAGDRVAIVSPSWAGPGVFAELHESSMEVLRREFNLEPVEFPTTREVGASARDRARDLMAAFADPSIAAVMATIGGEDQITVLPHLDPELLRAHPKRFFGYSDNTNLLNYLWNLGIVGYHGGSTMVHLARAGGPHPLSLESLRKALFTNDTVTLAPVSRFSDVSPNWADPSTLEHETESEAESGWLWHNAERSVSGATWGGNLEILHWNLAVGRWMQPTANYAGCVLVIETSEEMPSDEEVGRILRNFGERGLLEQFPAVVVAKPKAWNSTRRTSLVERENFRRAQQTAVLEQMARYNPEAIVVVGPDFGHTDPQYIVPYGGVMVVDGPRRTISMTY